VTPPIVQTEYIECRRVPLRMGLLNCVTQDPSVSSYTT